VMRVRKIDARDAETEEII